ncbi:MAG TPA: phenylacetate--CoA ligase [Treponema sp.]|nr:phenylacetate--CoA ligase [Treponema sp.]
MIWNETKECMSRDKLENLQGARLVKLVDRVYHNVEYYRKKMQAVGLLPGDIRGIGDLDKLPFTTKDDLRATYPFGLFAVPLSQITRVHASSGTTGKATVVGYTRHDIDVWSECVARCITMAGLGKSDVIQVAYGYGLFTGGLGAHYGVEKMGATVVPMSTGNTKKLVTMMVDFGVTGIMCTPSYLLHIAEVIDEMGVRDKIRLRASINGAEPWTEKMRRQIEERLGIHSHDIYGLSEVMGPGVAADCSFHRGLHIQEDHFLPEVVDPHTLKPLRDGMTGELVISTLTKEGLPLIRYRTKDLTSIDHTPCECGRTTARLARFTGRTDDMLIIRGVNVFPSQIEGVLLSKGYPPVYQIIVGRENNNDTFEVQVEMTENNFSDVVGDVRRKENELSNALQTILQIKAKVTLVAPKTIERSNGKAKRVIDTRKLHDN